MNTPIKIRQFEEFRQGETRRFGSYAVTADEIIAFARKYDPQFFHTDPEAAKSSLFGGLCASGWHSCAMCMAMMVEDMQVSGQSLGSPGVDELRWLKPVFPGDVLSVETEVLDLVPSVSRPEIGVVHSRVTVWNDKGQAVLSFLSRGIYPRDGARADPSV